MLPKLKSDTLRSLTAAHGWAGIVAGFALFVAFYAGAITVFHDAVAAWQSPRAVATQTLDDAQRLLDGTLQRHPDARKWVGMLLPRDGNPEAVVYWPDDRAAWHYATLSHPEGADRPSHWALSDLVNALHYALGYPPYGTYLMGIVSLLYGVALFTGLAIHLPHLLKDLFALRRGRNLKRFWQDAHNAVGVLGLPFHMVFAVTGAMLCLAPLLALALNPLVYRGELPRALPAAMDVAPVVAAAGVDGRIGTPGMWVAHARAVARDRGLPEFVPAYFKLVNAGDSNAVVEVTGDIPRRLGSQGVVALDAVSGRLLAAQLPDTRDANHASLSIAYMLHFGEYGNAVVRWSYFLLGIGGAFLFYSGNLLWIESRRKRRQPRQRRAHVNMARATVGACLGLCVAVSSAFVAAQGLEAAAPGNTGLVSIGIKCACFAVWGACFLWAMRRPPLKAARELLRAAAFATVAVPVAHGLATGWWPWRSIVAGRWDLFWVDTAALAMAFGFIRLARATAKRAREGDPNSVWADTP